MEYILERKTGAGRLSLHINPSGQVVVKAPRLLPKFLIDNFVSAQTDWIIKHQAKRQRQTAALADTSVLILGREYPRKTIAIDQLPSRSRLGTQISDNQVVFVTTHESTTTSQTAANHSLRLFLKSTAAAYISPRVQELGKLMGVSVPKVGLREQKTRWGSCSSRGTLHFNWRLVHFAPPVIDYVIVHELAHRIELNHSKSFWRVVAKYDPEYQQHQRQLAKLAIHA